MQYIEVSEKNNILTITLNRPNVKNALNLAMIQELHKAFSTISSEVRLVVLTGNGSSFCAGADLEWMQSMVQYSFEQNLAESRELQQMLAAIDNCQQPVIGQLHGYVMGGGVGLASCCDILVCADNTQFCLSEVKLGLIPAVISPYVLNKISLNRALPLSLSARLFSAVEALNWGFVHNVCPAGELNNTVLQWQNELLDCAPLAQRHTKKLFKQLPYLDEKTKATQTVELISRQRVSREGQKGLKGFLQKKPISWKTEKVEREDN